MKIIIAEKMNKEIEQWELKQDEPVTVITWISDLNYQLATNEINLYNFTRSKNIGIAITELPWTQYHVLNYRSVPGNHQFEFKNFDQDLTVKIYLAEHTHQVVKTETVDKKDQNIKVVFYANNQVTQRFDYDANKRPLVSRFIGTDKQIEVYWQGRQNKLVNTGMSLLEDGQEKFYNNYWDWHFEAFKKIINSLEDVSEVISYEAPTMNISVPNRRVVRGELFHELVVSAFKQAQGRTKWMLQFENKNFWKPRNDVALAASELGYRLVNLDVPYVDEAHWIKDQLTKHFEHVRPGDLVIWQYPKYSPALELSMLQWFHERQVTVAAFIHDVTLVRERITASDHYQPEDDKQLLSQFDANILPLNFVEPLADIAEVNLQNIVPLAPYDFRISETVTPATYSQNIFYAGSLVKFPKLQNIDFKLTVFGEKNFSNIKINNNNIHDGGFMPAEELAKQLNNGYGLIWDEDVDNEYRQRYTKWNWPYKFSLYMASGLPVIAWQGSAIAEVIKLGNLGLVVNSLSDVSDAIADVTVEDFNIMAQNAAMFGNKLANGESTKAALKALEDKLAALTIN